MKRLFLLTFLAPALWAGSLHAGSTDYLLELDGVKGESADALRPETIEIESFSWGLSNTATAGSTGGGGAGKVVMQDIHFTVKLSKASPQLLAACATAKTIPKATLYGRKSGSDRHEYYVIELENILVSSLKQSGQISSTTTPTAAPTEEFSLAYGKLIIKYTGADGTVTTGTAIRTPVQ